MSARTRLGTAAVIGATAAVWLALSPPTSVGTALLIGVLAAGAALFLLGLWGVS